MNIDELLEKKREVDAEKAKLTELFGGNAPDTIYNDGAWEVGKNYLVRTVTHIQTGKLASVGTNELVLEGAAWIADTGRFADSLTSCDFSEVEPFPEGVKVIVGRGAVIDAVQIKDLPRSQK